MLRQEDRSRHRRLGAFVVFAVGIAIVVAFVEPDLPRDQPLIFRLPANASMPVRLQVSFTEPGAARASRGFEVTLTGREGREFRHEVRIPNGDYLVTTELTSTHSSATNAAFGIETSELHRVTLNGQETIIVLDGEGSE